MVKEDILTPALAEIFSLVEKTQGLSINELARRLGISVGAAFGRVNNLESRHLFKTQRVGREKRVYLKDGCPGEETKRLLPLQTRARLMKKFALDELELKILLEAKGETFGEVAAELGVLPMLVEARIERSIPSKFGMGFREAREMIKKTLAAL